MLLGALIAAISTLFSPDEFVRVPLEVNIGLLGFSADGAWQLEVDAGELVGLLRRLLPVRRPSCGQDAAPLDALYKLEYNVVMMQTGLRRLHSRLAQALRPVAHSASSTEFEIEVADIEDHFDNLFASYFTGGHAADEPAPDPKASHAAGHSAAYTILVLNPNRADMAALRSGIPIGYSYRYRYHGGAPTQVWLSGSRYVVIDLSAGPCTIGRAQASEGAVSAASFPLLRPQLRGGDEGRRQREADKTKAAAYDLHHTHFVAQLATLLLSAVRHLVAPDASLCEPPAFTKLIVPLVVLTDHDSFDPLQSGHAHSVDIALLRQQLQRLLLSDQELLLLPSVHPLHAHPQISVAVTQAHRADTVHEPESGRAQPAAKPYLDASGLAHQMHHSVDWLAAGLMDVATAEHLSRVSVHSKKTSANVTASGHGDTLEGTRVLPLYLLSLLHAHPELLLDKGTLVHTAAEAVIVLQTNTSAITLPFTSDGYEVLADARKPTRHALAGLAAAVGGLLAPYESLRPSATAHFRSPVERDGPLPSLQNDFLWSTGQHPFGPYSNASSISQTLADVVQRNVVLGRLRSALRALRATTRQIEAVVARYVDPVSANSSEERISRLVSPPLVEEFRQADAGAASPLLEWRESWSGEAGELLGKLHTGRLELSSEAVQHVARRLYNSLLAFRPAFDEACAQLHAHRYHDAHHLALKVDTDAHTFAETVASELKKLRDHSACCTISTHSSASRANEIFGLVCVVVLLCAAGTCWK